MFENFQLPGDSCEDKVEVLFSMDPGQVVQEQVVGWRSGIVADVVSGILVQRDDQNLESFDLSYCLKEAFSVVRKTWDIEFCIE
jgi:hypothetical protein